MLNSLFDFPSLATAALTFGSNTCINNVLQSLNKESPIKLPNSPVHRSELDIEISRQAGNYSLLSTTLMQDLIQFHSKNRDLEINSFTQAFSEFLKQKIIELEAVEDESNIEIDELGNVVWSLFDSADQTPLKDRKVIFINSSYSTFFENKSDWSHFGPGLDCFSGLKYFDKIDSSKLDSLSYVPQENWWKKLTFGKGSTDGLQGIATQIISMKILLEKKAFNNVVIVCSISRHLHSPFHVVRGSKLYPHVVILSEATGKMNEGLCGFAIGQNGRAMIEITANHGFVIEDGCRAIAETAAENMNRNASKQNDEKSLLDRSSQVVQDAVFESSHFSARIVRTLTVGETGNDAIESIEKLPSVQKILSYDGSVSLSECESFLAWKVPNTSPIIRIIAENYRRMVSAYVDESDDSSPLRLRKEPFFLARGKGDGYCGFPLKIDNGKIDVDSNQESCLKDWFEVPTHKKTFGKLNRSYLFMPPTFAVGSGLIENRGMLGEFVCDDLIWAPIAIIARFPSLYAEQCE